MNRSCFIATLVLTLVIILTSCAEPGKEEEFIKNIDRVFKHEPRKFSFHVRTNPTSKEATPTSIYGPCEIKLIYDVKEGDLMWAKHTIEKHKDTYGGIKRKEILEIHMHSPEDVSGGGWDHGKFGKGQTEIVQ